MNRNRKRNLFLKKSTAAFAASMLVMTGITPVMAAGGYQEAEKKALNSVVESVKESWDEGLTDYQSVQKGMRFNITLQLDDAGRSMLGMFVPADVSWLERIGIDVNGTVSESAEAADMNLLLNDMPLCTMKVLIDFAGMTEYLQIPELSGSYLKAALTMQDNSGMEISEESMEAIWSLASDMTAVMPDAATVGTLLERYGTLLIENMEEGPSVEETVSVEGIGEACTVYEGRIYEEGIRDLSEQILTAAKEDKELENLLHTWSEAFEDSGDLYAGFQSGIESALADLEAEKADAGREDDTEDNKSTEYISSRIWVNGEDRILGREISLCDGIESQPLFTWKNPQKGDTSALLLEMQTDNGTISFRGSNEKSDGLRNGTYGIAVDGVLMANVEMENYDTQAAENGKLDGTFRLSFPQPEGDETAYNPFQNFVLVLNIASDANAGMGELELTLESAGVSLGSLKITGSQGEGIEIPDLEKLDKVYDLENESDVASYLDEVNWDSILENAGKAGVPEELVTQLDSLIRSALYEEAASEEGIYEENASEDTGEGAA